MNLTDTHPIAGTRNKEEDTMKNTNPTKMTFGGLAALAVAGLALTGCTSLTTDPAKDQPQVTTHAEVEQPAATDLPAEGSYVRAAPSEDASPEERYTLSVDGQDVKVTRAYCEPKRDGSTQPTLNPSETATGEVGEDGTVTWYDGGAYTDEATTALETRAEGNVLLVDGEAFYYEHSGVVDEDSYMHGSDVSWAWAYSACGVGGES